MSGLCELRFKWNHYSRSFFFLYNSICVTFYIQHIVVIWIVMSLWCIYRKRMKQQSKLSAASAWHWWCNRVILRLSLLSVINKMMLLVTSLPCCALKGETFKNWIFQCVCDIFTLCFNTNQGILHKILFSGIFNNKLEVTQKSGLRKSNEQTVKDFSDNKVNTPKYV